jgi:hypothetical protein
VICAVNLPEPSVTGGGLGVTLTEANSMAVIARFGAKPVPVTAIDQVPVVPPGALVGLSVTVIACWASAGRLAETATRRPQTTSATSRRLTATDQPVMKPAK